MGIAKEVNQAEKREFKVVHWSLQSRLSHLQNQGAEASSIELEVELLRTRSSHSRQLSVLQL